MVVGGCAGRQERLSYPTRWISRGLRIRQAVASVTNDPAYTPTLTIRIHAQAQGSGVGSSRCIGQRERRGTWWQLAGPTAAPRRGRASDQTQPPWPFLSFLRCFRAIEHAIGYCKQHAACAGWHLARRSQVHALPCTRLRMGRHSHCAGIEAHCALAALGATYWTRSRHLWCRGRCGTRAARLRYTCSCTVYASSYSCVLSTYARNFVCCALVTVS